MANSIEELRRLQERRKNKPGYKANVKHIEAEIRRLEQ